MIMENKMETTIGFRVQGLDFKVHSDISPSNHFSVKTLIIRAKELSSGFSGSETAEYLPGLEYSITNHMS